MFAKLLSMSKRNWP